MNILITYRKEKGQGPSRLRGSPQTPARRCASSPSTVWCWASPQHQTATVRYLYATAALALFFLASCAVQSGLHYPPARWISDKDTTPILQPKADKPRNETPVVNQKVYDQLQHVAELTDRIGDLADMTKVSGHQEALNTNNFDEVADSTWFTNRIGRFGLSIKDIVDGKGDETGLTPKGRWLVLAVDMSATVPKIVVSAANSDAHYLLKFDPPSSPGLETAAEFITSKLLYAAGYNTFEDVGIVEFDPKILAIAKDSWIKTAEGGTELLSQDKLQMSLKAIAPPKGGKCRAVAARLPDGEPLGPFSPRGRRYKDVNDRIPHEHRRELRAYRVFCSLLNYADVRSSDTMDIFIPAYGDMGYIKHYLVNFSDSLKGITQDTGEEDEQGELSERRAMGAMYSFGFYDPFWTQTEKQERTAPRTTFDPGRWHPRHPNTAFYYMTDRDAFWAAKILMRFSDEMVNALVNEAQIPGASVGGEIAKTLIRRRNTIGKFWFSRLVPLDNFQLTSESNGDTLLNFDDLAVIYHLVSERDVTYRYQLRNSTARNELSPWTEINSPVAVIGKGVTEKMRPGRTYTLRIEARQVGTKWWGPAVDIYLKKGDLVKLIGIKRRHRN